MTFQPDDSIGPERAARHRRRRNKGSQADHTAGVWDDDWVPESDMYSSAQIIREFFNSDYDTS